MTIRGKAFIAGAYEHPDRKIPDKSVAQVHAEVALGALADAGLTLSRRRRATSAPATRPGSGRISMADYLGLKRLRYMDSTETGGSSYLVHVGHAAAAIADGQVPGRPHHAGRAAQVTAGRARASARAVGAGGGVRAAVRADDRVDVRAGGAAAHARVRHHQRAAGRDQGGGRRQHAQYNPNAMLRNPVTVEEVLDSPMISDPLHRLDCCVITDGGGALVVVVAGGRQRTCARQTRQGARPRRVAEARRQRPHRPDLHRRGVVRAAGVRGGGRDASRHRLRVDLRLVHDHRAADDRGPRVLREGQGRRVRGRRRRCWRRTAGCRSTPTAAACATTTRPTGAG